MSIDRFVGTWRLVSFVSLLDSGEEIKLFGENPIGYISYSRDGYVQVNIMHENFKEQNEVTIHNYLSYAGRFEPDESVVTHYMDVSSVQTWAGGKQKRAYEFPEDGVLILSTVDTMTIDGQTFVGNKLVWKKV